MSSAHLIIVARNTETGEIRLPLGDMTLYDMGDEQSILETCRMAYPPEWSLVIYRPASDFYSGTREL